MSSSATRSAWRSCRSSAWTGSQRMLPRTCRAPRRRVRARATDRSGHRQLAVGTPAQNDIYGKLAALGDCGGRAHVDLENPRERLAIGNEMKAHAADRQMQLPRVDVRAKAPGLHAPFEDACQDLDDLPIAFDLAARDVPRVVNVLAHHEAHEHFVVAVIVEAAADDFA